MSKTSPPGDRQSEMGERTLLGSQWSRQLEDKSCRIGVIGLGYVGLPLALAFAESGFATLGFDVDADKVEVLASGRSYIDNIDGRRIAECTASGRFEATSDLARLGEPDAILVCVPTPVSVHRVPDLSYVHDTGAAIAETLRRGQLIVLESTTYPGTTDAELLPILERSSLRLGEDFLLAFSPEREDPGNPDYSTTTIPKVVGGVDVESGRVAAEMYRAVVSETVEVSSARVAEAAKLTENVFRAINIALVNDLKVLYDTMGIDVREVLDAAETKPFGFMRFDPGPGWGGHCIPVDPFYLAWKAREYGLASRFIELAGTINLEMPKFVVSKLQGALNERGKAVHGSKVMVLGLAYKRDVADPRESPAFEILAQLHELGAELSYHDPHVARTPTMRSWPDLPCLESTELTEQSIAAQDAILVVTDHTGVDYDLVAKRAQLIVDTRGVYRGRPEVVSA